MISLRQMILVTAVFIIFLTVLSIAGKMDLSKTGQTASYYPRGDGDLQMSVA